MDIWLTLVIVVAIVAFVLVARSAMRRSEQGEFETNIDKAPAIAAGGNSDFQHINAPVTYESVPRRPRPKLLRTIEEKNGLVEDDHPLSLDPLSPIAPALTTSEYEAEQSVAVIQEPNPFDEPVHDEWHTVQPEQDRPSEENPEAARVGDDK